VCWRVINTKKNHSYLLGVNWTSLFSESFCLITTLVSSCTFFTSIILSSLRLYVLIMMLATDRTLNGVPLTDSNLYPNYDGNSARWRKVWWNFPDLCTDLMKKWFIWHVVAGGGDPRRNFVKMFDADKTRMIGLSYGKQTMTDGARLASSGKSI